MAAWAGYGGTPQTKPSYLADLWVAMGYRGFLAQFMEEDFVPIGDTDSTRVAPCDVVLGREFISPGKPTVRVGATGAGVVNHAAPGGGTVRVYYPC